MSWFVVIEWDGEKPPTTWYRRLHTLGLYVQGDKRKSPLVRRETNGNGLIMQEGAIIVPSKSLARLIAGMAYKGVTYTERKSGKRVTMKARMVSIGEVKLTSKIQMTDEDRAVLKRVEDVLSRRGRPSPKRDWTVVCYEEMAAHHIEAPYAFNCPHCGGLRVQVHPGRMPVYRDPGGDVFKAWQRLRFGACGMFVPGKIDPAGDMPPSKVGFTQGQEVQAVKALGTSPAITAALNCMTREEAFNACDAILTARVHWSHEDRLKARIAAATLFFQQGGSPASISLAETTAIDLLDAAGPLGPETVAGMLIIQEKGQ